MRRVIAVGVLWASLLVVAFLVLGDLALPRALQVGSSDSAVPAAVGMGVLASDALVPVPASMVAMFLGAVYGTGAGGLFSWIGMLASGVVCLCVGRIAHGRSGRVSLEWSATLARHGAALIAVTRPIPLLAEVVAITAGACRIPVRKFLLGASVGCVPPAFVYAWSGDLGGVHGSAGFLLVNVACVLSAVLIGWRRKSWNR